LLYCSIMGRSKKMIHLLFPLGKLILSLGIPVGYHSLVVFSASHLEKVEYKIGLDFCDFSEKNTKCMWGKQYTHQARMSYIRIR
jgi:hypothetical protein